MASQATIRPFCVQRAPGGKLEPRNPDRFPERFCLRLTKEDAEVLTSQIVMSGAELGKRGDHWTHMPRVLTDRIPVQKKNSAIIGPVKGKLKTLLGDDVGYSLAPMESRSDFGLQAADYCSWAIYRAWTNGDMRPREIIAPSLRRETDLLAGLGEEYY